MRHVHAAPDRMLSGVAHHSPPRSHLCFSVAVGKAGPGPNAEERLVLAAAVRWWTVALGAGQPTGVLAGADQRPLRGLIDALEPYAAERTQSRSEDRSNELPERAVRVETEQQ